MGICAILCVRCTLSSTDILSFFFSETIFCVARASVVGEQMKRIYVFPFHCILFCFLTNNRIISDNWVTPVVRGSSIRLKTFLFFFRLA